MGELSKYRSNTYSQYGEDGILREIFNRIGVDGGWFCEFGAWDGKYLSNTYRLVDEEEDWRGVMIEGDESKFQELRTTRDGHQDSLTIFNEYVSHREKEQSIDHLLSKTDIPTELELMSIDVDGEDYFIWEDMSKHQPSVVVIEVSGEIPPPIKQISEVRTRGTSFKSMVELGNNKGYSPVCHTPANLILVRDEFVESLQLPEVELEHPQVLFDNSFYQSSDDGEVRAHEENPIWVYPYIGIRVLRKKGLVNGTKDILSWIKDRYIYQSPSGDNATDPEREWKHLNQANLRFEKRRSQILDEYQNY